MEQIGSKYSQFRKLNIFKKTPKGIKLLTRLTLGLSHLCEYKFKHSFQDSLNSICSCDKDIETSAPFLLHCPNCSNERSTFLNTIGSINR